MLIRRANAEDAKQAYPLYQALIGRDQLRVFYNPEDFQYLIQCPNCYFLVALDENEQVIGFLQAFDNVIWGYIDVFYVKPEYRHHKIGIGLLNALLQVKNERWRAIELCYDPEDSYFASWLAAQGYAPLTADAKPLRWVSKICESIIQ